VCMELKTGGVFDPNYRVGISWATRGQTHAELHHAC